MKLNINMIVKKMGTGLLFALIGTLIVCALIGCLEQMEIVSEGTAKILAGLLMELVFLLCCYSAVKKFPQSRLVYAMILAVFYIGARMLTKALFFPDVVLVLGWQCVVTLVAAIVAGLLASMPKQRRR